MAACVHESTTATAWPTAASTQAADYPATIAGRELLIAVIATDRGPNAVGNVPPGWKELYVGGRSTAHGCHIIARVADPADAGGTFDYELNFSEAGACHVLRISNFAGTIGTDIDIATLEHADLEDTPDPPEVTAGWGSTSNLWIAGWASGDDDATTSAYPSGYTTLQTNTISGAGTNSGAEVTTCSKTATAASDNPGTGTMSEVEGCTAFTIVVKSRDLTTYAQDTNEFVGIDGIRSDTDRDYDVVGVSAIWQEGIGAAPSGRIMSSLAAGGGLAGYGGLAGHSGGLAG